MRKNGGKCLRVLYLASSFVYRAVYVIEVQSHRQRFIYKHSRHSHGYTSNYALSRQRPSQYWHCANVVNLSQ